MKLSSYIEFLNRTQTVLGYDPDVVLNESTIVVELSDGTKAEINVSGEPGVTD